MIFLELSLENFGPYLGKNIINLRPENDGETRPIILFGGMNGGGKTTLMDAIRLTLYGNRAQCSTRGNLSYSEFLNQSVHRHTPPTGKTRIELTFEHIQEDKPTIFKVVRYWTKEPKDGKDTLGVLVYDHYLREWWPDKALTTAWDEYIETLLPLGISNLFLFDGEQVKELAEIETPPSLVVDAIRSLLGLELVERLSVDLDILISRKFKEIAGAKELATIERLEKEIQDLSAERDIAAQENHNCQTQLVEKQKALRLVEEKFIYEAEKIAGERNQLEQQTELKQQAETTRQTMVELASGVLPLCLISSQLNQVQTQAENETQQQQVKIEKEALKKRNDRLLQYITELPLKPKQIEKIKAFLDQEYQELEQAASNSEKPWLLADIEVIEQLENLLRYELKAKQDIGEEKINKLKEIESKEREKHIEFLGRELVSADYSEIYEKLQKNVRQAQKELAKAQAAKEMANRQFKAIEEELEKTRQEIEQYSQEHIKVRNSKHIITSAAKVQNTLKLFKEKLTLKKLNKLEKEVTQCFCYLLHKTDLVHRIVIDTQTFSLFLYDTQGKAVPKHRLSAGEKQLLAISFLWGLARVSGRHLPVAIDTPLGRLDSSHRQNLIERYFPAASHQVILLSTDTEIGKIEVENLRKLEAIAREYLLKYDANNQQTIVDDGYFW